MLPLRGLPSLSLLQARRTLEGVARQVQPILRRRNFTVPLLREFFPRNARLLVRSGCCTAHKGVACRVAHVGAAASRGPASAA